MEKHIKTFNEHQRTNEDLDTYNNIDQSVTDFVNSPAVSSDNLNRLIEIGFDDFLGNPTLIALATAWLIIGDNREEFKTNTKNILDSFLLYCNSCGYTIDKDALKYNFSKLINKVKKILKLE